MSGIGSCRAAIMLLLAGLGAPGLAMAETLPLTLHAHNATHHISAEIADTPRAREIGLMNRSELAPGHGMLFLYGGMQQSGNDGYWMYHTQVALDIAFIGVDGTIKRIFSMPPCQSEDQQQCPVYRPGVPYTAALEVPAGYFSAQGIVPGDSIEFPAL